MSASADELGVIGINGLGAENINGSAADRPLVNRVAAQLETDVSQHYAGIVAEAEVGAEAEDLGVMLE